MGSLVKRLAEERDKYKSICENINVSIDDLIFLRECLDNKKSYESLQAIYSKYKEKEGKEDKGFSFYERTKNTTNASSTFHKNIERSHSPANIKNPHR